MIVNYLDKTKSPFHTHNIIISVLLYLAFVVAMRQFVSFLPASDLRVIMSMQTTRRTSNGALKIWVCLLLYRVVAIKF